MYIIKECYYELKPDHPLYDKNKEVNIKKDKYKLYYRDSNIDFMEESEDGIVIEFNIDGKKSFKRLENVRNEKEVIIYKMKEVEYD